MTLDEFGKRLDAFLEEKYSVYDPGVDSWTADRQEAKARRQCRDMLMDHAREVQMLPVSRRGKNKAQRLFEELEIDPASLELDDLSAPRNDDELPKPSRNGRIMYIERKDRNMTGEARIGWVTTSKSGRTLHYGGKTFRTLDGTGYKANYYCVESGEEYWISGCKKDGSDRLYGERVPIHIDEDVREEYWTRIRLTPELKEKPAA
jgi:hypothetical protein